MLIQINITIPSGGSAGPFNLFSDADGYVSPFQTRVSVANLIAGYIIELPLGATIVRICSIGTCENCIDIPTNCTTTTSTSSTTTTSTSSTTTTTTTTAAPPYKFDYELITGTPTDIGTVNLQISVDGVIFVNTTISVGNTSQFGTFLATPGQVITAIMVNAKTGTYNFGNKILKDAVLYQPQDNCFSCVNQLVTPLFSPYSMISADTAWIFQGDINLPVPPVTSTTSTTSTTSSSTTTTTTTSSQALCCLTGGAAEAIYPVTTTSTTTSPPIVTVGMSSSSNDSGVSACNFPITQNLFMSQQNVGTITIGDVFYNNPFGTSPYLGGGNEWHVVVASSGSPNGYSVVIPDSGIVSVIDVCP